MNRRTWTCLSCILCATFWLPASGAEGISSTEPPLGPDREGYSIRMLENDPELSIRALITLEDLRIDSLTVDGRPFVHVWIPEAASLLEEGHPLLPVISRHFRISDTRDVAVTVQPLSERTVAMDAPLLPSQGIPVEDVREIRHESSAALASLERLPRVQAWTDAPMVLRDIRVLQISYCPVTYDPASRSLRIIEQAELRITPLPGSGTNPKTHWGPVHRSWAKLYRAVVANPDPDWQNLLNRGRERYLLVFPDEFEPHLQGYIGWKEEQGYYVDLLRMSEVGSLNWQDLHNELLLRYNSTERPDWVCLMGNTNNTPWTNNTGFSYTDDLCFSLMEGADYLPDFYFARLPARDVDGLMTMLNRTLYWEREPQMDNPDMYVTAFMASANNYQSQTTVKEQTGERLQRVHDFTTVHTMYNWSSTSLSTLIGWIEDGVSIINYRGEGWRDGWNPQSYQYHFHVPDVQTIQNPFHTPIITSIGCGVCGFASGNPCFGEAWMELGSPTLPMGCVAIMGPTGNTHTTYNNWMDRGIYRGLAYDDLTQTAAAYLAGKMYMKEHFPEPSHAYTVEQSFREFVNLGMPDVQYRTSIPRDPYVSLGYPPDSMDPVVALRAPDGEKFVDSFVSCETATGRLVMEIDENAGGITLPAGLTSFTLVMSGYNLQAVRKPLAQEDRYGQLLITEAKVDIPSNGLEGDLVELFNPGLESVDLSGWVLTDLDYFDGTFVEQSAPLAPGDIAVIEFLGPKADESVQATAYGLYIQSRALPGFSSHEDQVILRAPDGSAVDGFGYHNGTGITTLNQASDISRLTGPGTPFTMRTHAWWEGPNWIHEDDYEDYTIDWSLYAGSGGDGSIHRISTASPDSPAHFEVRSDSDFGVYIPTR